MSDNRKYYYLKLKENYFDDDSIVLLESMQDGVLYSNILLKLYLKSLKHGGRLQLDEDIPYTAQMIATITRQQIGTVERALQIFLKLGLVEVLDSGTFYIDSYNNSDTRGNSPSYGTNYQKLGHELMSRDELAVLDGGKCILQLRGVRPFLSDKYDLTQHPNYKYTSDYDPKNALDIEKFLNRKEKIHPDDTFIMVDADSLPPA